MCIVEGSFRNCLCKMEVQKWLLCITSWRITSEQAYSCVPPHLLAVSVLYRPCNSVVTYLHDCDAYHSIYDVLLRLLAEKHVRGRQDTDAFKDWPLATQGSMNLSTTFILAAPSVDPDPVCAR
jgi:hypothetical protein